MATTWRTTLFAIAMGLATSCSTPTAQLAALETPAPTTYRLGAGDEIRVTVYGLDPLTNTYIVSDTGTISLPLLDPVPVDGKTIPEVEAAIASAISSKELVARAPSVSAQVQKYRPFYILGEVQRPGQYPYAPGLTVTSAVSIAGGFTFRADTKSFAITRKGAQGAVKGKAGPETPVAPGDTVEVYESWF